jgi:lipopolysaccharide export system permease protein
MVFFVNQILLVAAQILEKRVAISKVLLLMLYSLPFIIAQSAPFATLVGFLMCLGRLVSDNEILVIRASGKSYLIILIPVLILGMIISVFSFAVNDYLLPLGTLSYNRLYRSIILSNPEIELEPHSIKRTDSSTIVIGNVDGLTISDMVFFDTDEKNNQRIIIAGESQIAKSPDTAVLMQITMDQSSVVFLDQQDRLDFDYMLADSAIMNIFNSTFFSQPTTVSPREMTSYDLKQRITDLKKPEKKANPSQINLYELEYYKKFSLPFGSLFFAMLAMPLAVIFGKHNGQTIGLIVGLILSVIYWTLLILGQTFGSRSGFSGFWTMWLPDFLVGICGLVLYFRLVRR